MKWLATAAAAVIALLLGGSAIAADGRPVVETLSPSFVLSSAACSNLSAGTTITAPQGSGTGKSITTTTTASSGVTTIINTTIEHGRATDQDGNTYVYIYLNRFRVSNTIGDPGVFSGLMTDRFSLFGRGPARLSNGFVGTFTTDFSSFVSVQPISSFGDPISFPDATAHCDPL